jgi:hypothetical protein
MVKVPRTNLESDAMPIRFRVEARTPERVISAERKSTFFSR